MISLIKTQPANDHYKDEIEKFKAYMGTEFYYHPTHYKTHYGWIQKCLKKLNEDKKLTVVEIMYIKDKLFEADLEMIWTIIMKKIL